MKNFEKDNASGKNHKGSQNRPLRYLTASSIIGDRILDLNEEKLGMIKDIMIDLTNGKIEYVIMELGGFFGIGEKYFAIPFSSLKVDSKNECFTLDQDIDIIKNSPGFDKDHWPETNDHMADHIGTYWGGFMGSNTGSTY